MKIFLKLLIFSFIMFISYYLKAQPYKLDVNKMVTEIREIKDFNAVKIQGLGTLYIKQGNIEELIIKYPANLTFKIHSSVTNNTLNIFPEDNIKHPINFFSRPGIQYYLTVKHLENISCVGSISVVIKEALQADKFNLYLSGSSKVEIAINVQKLEVYISGSSSVIALGNAQEQEVHISGSGKMDGTKLLGKKSSLYIKGSGLALVNVTDELNLKISGSGSIKYQGTPKVIQEISGSASVNNF